MSGLLDLLLGLGGELSQTEEQHGESFISSLQRCLFTKENFLSSDLLNQLSAGGADGPGNSGRLDHVTWDKISRITIGIGQAMLSGQLSLKLFLF